MKIGMPRFDSARVLVLGDIMLDRYWQGGASRISPEAPVPVVRVDQITDRPGGAGNVALNIAALGAAPTLLGYTGEDEMADSLQDMLDGAGVECIFRRDAGRRTITKLRVISRQQQLIRLDFEAPDLLDDEQVLALGLEDHLDRSQAIVLSDYGKGALRDPAPIIAAARIAGLPVLVDPKGVDFERYRGASLLTPNLHEFEAVVGHCETEQELVAKGEKLMLELQLGALLITRGEHGMTLLRPAEEEFHLPARAMEVFDVTGAGDTVIAVLAAAVAAG
ncbi:MAG: D-glycero-beta-D-manno-heptose-7-phosphate kinase, partial [Halieaceae bacterium]|nr:D-glycero-beta-D-manno-heptose-7-phosphate kinase [Halieaceae bacterium]